VRVLPGGNAAQTIILLICMSISIAPTAHARSVLEKLDEAIAAMSTYRSGDSPEALELVYGLTVKSQGSAAARRAMSERLAGLLDGSATIEARIFACKQLHLIGGDESVPVLKRSLGDPELAEVALYALDGIRTTAADRALRHALETAPSNLKVSVINSLAERRDAFSVNSLSGLVYKRDDAIATAAIRALGRIGDDQAARAIARAREGAPEPRKVLLTEALFVAADNLQARGQGQSAAAYYDQLYRSPENPAARLTAFRGLANALGDEAAPVIVDALKSDSYELAATACGFVAGASLDAAATNQFASLLAQLEPDIQPLLLDALGERGDPAAASVVRTFAVAQDIGVRLAALRAIARLGDASDVALLVDASAGIGAIATEPLVRLAGPGVSDAIVRMASDGETENRIPLIIALGERADPETVPALLRFAQDDDPGIREAAFEACGLTADASSIKELAGLLVRESDGDARKTAERALIALSKYDAAVGSAELSAVLQDARNDDAVYASVIRVLASTEQPEALDAIRTAARSRDDAIRKTAVAAFANWPNADPLPDLERLAKGKKDDPVRIEAFRGYVTLIRLPSDRTTKQTVKLYGKAKKLSETADDAKLILAGLAEVRDQDALKLARKYENDRDVSKEAAIAIQQIERNAYRAIASHAAADAEKAFDGNPRSRWTTRTDQSPGQWFQLDLGWPYTISGIKLDTERSANDFPRGYEIFLSNDGERWGDPIAQGRGNESAMTITFKAKKTRFVKIVQTGSADGQYWSIHEITMTK
jgi:HEAT repeat protein